MMGHACQESAHQMFLSTASFHLVQAPFYSIIILLLDLMLIKSLPEIASGLENKSCSTNCVCHQVSCSKVLTVLALLVLLFLISSLSSLIFFSLCFWVVPVVHGSIIVIYVTSFSRFLKSHLVEDQVMARRHVGNLNKVRTR